MNFNGGYNILLEGKPSPVVDRLPEPKKLYLPLRSRRFFFNEICVEDGQQVNAGDIIARNPKNFALPLLAPRGGTVELKTVANHVVLTDIFPPDKKVHIPEKRLPHIAQELGTAGIKRYKLLSLGACQFFYDACGQKELTLTQKRHNRLVAGIRAVVEHPFAWMKNAGHGRTRYRGMRRNALDFGLHVIAYNWKRSFSLASITA